MIALVLASTFAIAGGSQFNFDEEVQRAMKLPYDVDQVQEMLQSEAPAAEALMSLPPIELLPLEPNSEVDRVVVFGDRALVTRTLTQDLAAGHGVVVFEGLPHGLVAETLQATVASGSAQIVGVELHAGTGKVEESDRTEALRKESLEIAGELGAVRDRIEALISQREYLRSALLSPPVQGSPRPALGEVKGALGLVSDTERAIAGALRKEQEAAAKLDEKLQPLLVKLRDPSATGRTVKVDVESKSGGDVVVALTYQVGGASWSPSYNARLDQAKGTVTIEYYAIVAQSTRELWKDVELELSTADPAIAGALPELGVWALGRGAEGDLYDGRGGFTEHTNRDIAQSAMPSAEPVSTEMHAKVQGSGAVVFALPGRRTVAGDGSSQRFPVSQQSFPVLLELSAVPKLVPAAYRRGRIVYQGAAPLLPGEVASYVGTDYVGGGWIDSVVPGEEIKLAFGVDDRVRVERVLVTREEESLNRKTVRWTFHFRIEATNHSDKPQTVLVTDQLPVSEVDRVTVEDMGTSAALTPEEDDPAGLLRWKMEIPAGKKEAIDVKFRVTAPKEYGVQYQLM